jgi:DNA-binding LytR/AlgR family response regulator
MTDENKIKLLILEDDMLIAESLRASLEDLGYDVYEPCNTAETAINALNSQSFDVALLDMDIKGKDIGIQVGKLISTRYHFPFIYLTAFGDNATIAAAAQAHPSGYLIKPASPSTLFAAIQNAIYNFENHETPGTMEAVMSQGVFFVKIGNKLNKINWSDVVCISSGKNYISIQINKSGFPEFPIRSSIEQAINHLVPPELRDNFVRISKSHCINISHVLQLQDNTITTQMGNFELTDRYKKIFMEKIKII